MLLNYGNHAIHETAHVSTPANLAGKLALASGIIFIIGASVSTAAAALALWHTQNPPPPSNTPSPGNLSPNGINPSPVNVPAPNNYVIYEPNKNIHSSYHYYS